MFFNLLIRFSIFLIILVKNLKFLLKKYYNFKVFEMTLKQSWDFIMFILSPGELCLH